MAYLLIVDDDLNIGNLLEEVLSKEGYSVSRAYSGSAGRGLSVKNDGTVARNDVPFRQ